MRITHFDHDQERLRQQHKREVMEDLDSEDPFDYGGGYERKMRQRQIEDHLYRTEFSWVTKEAWLSRLEALGYALIPFSIFLLLTIHSARLHN